MPALHPTPGRACASPSWPALRPTDYATRGSVLVDVAHALRPKRCPLASAMHARTTCPYILAPWIQRVLCAPAIRTALLFNTMSPAHAHQVARDACYVLGCPCPHCSVRGRAPHYCLQHRTTCPLCSWSFVARALRTMLSTPRISHAQGHRAPITP